MWMLLSAAFGFFIGDAFGDSTRHRSVSNRPTKTSAMNREGPRRKSLYTGNSKNNAASSMISTNK